MSSAIVYLYGSLISNNILCIKTILSRAFPEVAMLGLEAFVERMQRAEDREKDNRRDGGATKESTYRGLTLMKKLAGADSIGCPILAATSWRPAEHLKDTILVCECFVVSSPGRIKHSIQYQI
jgi:hypothetical protein